MCNCGNKRNNYAQQVHSNVANPPVHTALNNSIRNSASMKFQYTGKTAFTVRGTITGNHYRFNYPGDIQSIDARDATGMMVVPALKKI